MAFGGSFGGLRTVRARSLLVFRGLMVRRAFEMFESLALRFDGILRVLIHADSLPAEDRSLEEERNGYVVG